MFKNCPKRDEQYMLKLTGMLLDYYNISAVKIIESKRGFYGETWKVQSSQVNYFVKIDYWNCHKEIYKKSFTIIDYFTRKGINHTPKVIKTKSGDLYTSFGDGVLGVFEFIEGENTEDYPIERLFEKLAPIYKLPADGLQIEKETFNIDIVCTYKNALQELACINTESSKQILMLLNSNGELIELFGQKLRLFSERCKVDLSSFYITHGDAGANCIINDDDFVIIDWDYPKLAPIERDAWFFMWSQVKTINTVLKQNNISYMLNPDRLCFYCYYSFFYYLTEYIQVYFCLKSESAGAELAEYFFNYFHSWIFTPLSAANKYS